MMVDTTTYLIPAVTINVTTVFAENLVGMGFL